MDNIGSRVVQKIRRDETTGNIKSVPIHETVITRNGIIALREIPNEWERIQINDKNGNSFNEVFSIDNIKSKNDYYVDYSYGNIYLHNDTFGELLQLNYYGIGNEYLSANAIFTKLDRDGNIIELLSDIIEQGRDYIDAVNAFGTTVEILNMLDIKINEAQIIIDKSIQIDEEISGKLETVEQTSETLTQAIVLGNQTNTNIRNNIDTANSVNTTLVNNTNSATTINSTLSSTITTGQNTITDLTNLISLGQNIISTLQMELQEKKV